MGTYWLWCSEHRCHGLALGRPSPIFLSSAYFTCSKNPFRIKVQFSSAGPLGLSPELSCIKQWTPTRNPQPGRPVEPSMWGCRGSIQSLLAFADQAKRWWEPLQNCREPDPQAENVPWRSPEHHTGKSWQPGYHSHGSPPPCLAQPHQPSQVAFRVALQS